MQKAELVESDLQIILSEAGSRMGTTIEMPFFSSNQQTYMLTVLLTPESHEPLWTYYRGDDSRAQILWRHPTGDVNLVLNLCANETGTVGTDYQATSMLSGMPNAPQSQAPPAMTTYQSLQPVSSIPNSVMPPNVTSGNQITTQAGSNKTATLEGDLSNMQIPTLVQSINMSKMTGRLVIFDKGQQAMIYFVDGAPTHALTAECAGDAAIVELITWEEGQFHFYPNELTNERSVKKRVDSLLMEGVTLLDQNRYCKEQGVTLQSYLFRRNEGLTEEAFRAALTRGAPLDIDTQKRFYSAVDGNSLLDLLRKMPMTRNEWVPIMFNMLSCGLVGVSDTPPQGLVVRPVLAIPPFEIDRSAIQGVARTLMRPETNILTYPAFLYLLELEYTKCAGMGIPLSVVVFDLQLRVGTESQNLPLNFLREVLRRVESAKRPFDMLGHFELFQHAMFLPNTSAKSAKVFAVRLLELLAADSGIPKLAGQLSIAMGIASAPEDTPELAVLLAAAREAQRRCKETGSPLTLFSELNIR